MNDLLIVPRSQQESANDACRQILGIQYTNTFSVEIQKGRGQGPGTHYVAGTALNFAQREALQAAIPSAQIFKKGGRKKMNGENFFHISP